MRISIPTVKLDTLARSIPPLSLEAAIERLAGFLQPGKAAVLTGAGMSVDSGIRAYRGEFGRYLNPNYHPILYQELVDPTPKGRSFRQRYWARSYLGWEPVRVAQPNPGHYALAALQHSNIVKHLITQNVDGLDFKASPRSWGSYERHNRILELHGRLRTVSCLHGHSFSRVAFQERMSALNPSWKEYADDLARTRSELRTNPDGDVELRGRSFNDFMVPPCLDCQKEGRGESSATMIKPDVIFFGETIPAIVKKRCLNDLEACERLLVIGTTLATYSAFRIVKHALESAKPVLLLNIGPTRADALAVDKLEWRSGDVLKDAVSLVLGERVSRDPELRHLLDSGVVQRPLRED